MTEIASLDRRLGDEKAFSRDERALRAFHGDCGRYERIESRLRALEAEIAKLREEAKEAKAQAAAARATNVANAAYKLHYDFTSPTVQLWNTNLFNAASVNPLIRS